MRMQSWPTGILSLLVLIAGLFLTKMSSALLLPSILLCGTVFGISGVLAAHELGHTRHKVSRAFAVVLLACSSQIWWFIEHNRFHHRLVGLREDGATARKGETFWRYLVRYLWTALRHVGRYSKAWLVCSITIPLVVALLLSLSSIAYGIYFLGVGLVSIFLLALVNYIEHYGLERQLGEQIGEGHAWVSPHDDPNSFLGQLFLQSLPNHADHHIRAYKPFKELTYTQNSPVLPFRYWKMIFLALFPKQFFRVMHKYV
jgi:alkane 1-monooxygenase